MIQNRGFDMERRLAVEDAIDKATAISGFNCKCLLEAQSGRADGQIGTDLGYGKDQIGRETIDKIPTIGTELVVDLIDEAVGSVERDRLLPSDQHSQQVIKSDKVVDVRVRDKDVLETLNFSRRQMRYIAKIKHDRPLFKQRLDVERRIAGAPID